MGAATFNILGNMAIVIFETLIDAGTQVVEYKQEKDKLKSIAERRKNREIITKEAKDPGSAIKIFEFEITLYEILAKIRDWVPQRKWLLKKKVDIKDYPEEIEYQSLLEKYKLKEKAEYVRMSKNMISVARKQTALEIQRIQAKNAMIKHKR